MSNSEQIVIGSVLLSCSTGSSRPDVFFLKPYHFAHTLRSSIWGSILELEKSGAPIDPVAACAGVAHGDAFQVDEEIGQCLQCAATSHAAEWHAKAVIDTWIRKTLTVSAVDFISRCNSGAGIDELLASADMISASAQADCQTDTMVTLGSLMESAANALQTGEDRSCVCSGIQAFDGYVGGFRRGLVSIVAARPSMGKTAFVVNVLRNIGMAGKHGAMFSLEDTSYFISLRALAREAQIHYSNMVFRRLHKGHHEAISQALIGKGLHNVYVDDKPGRSVQSIRRMIVHHRKTAPMDLVIIDHLGELTDDMEAYKSTSRAVREIRDMAKELDIAVVLLTQLNRRCEERSDKRPIMSDLRDSGRIEEVARLVCFLYRHSQYDPSADENEMEIIVAKNSNGRTGKFSVYVDLSTMTVR